MFFQFEINVFTTMIYSDIIMALEKRVNLIKKSLNRS